MRSGRREKSGIVDRGIKENERIWKDRGQGVEMVGGSVSLGTARAVFCVYLVFLFMFHRPQRETARRRVIILKRER